MKFKINIKWRWVLAAIFTAFALNQGFAEDDGSIGSINTALCAVIDVLQGPMAKGIGTIAIVFLAFGMFMSKVSWGVALATALAIAVIFGAGDIADLLIGGGVSDTCSSTSTSNTTTTTP